MKSKTLIIKYTYVGKIKIWGLRYIVLINEIGDEKIIIITRLDGQIDYFLKVDNTGYLENDWLALPEKEFNQMNGSQQKS